MLRNNRTYVELKYAPCVLVHRHRLCNNRTYVELKSEKRAHGLHLPARNNRTYVELKLRYETEDSSNYQVIIVLMQN